MNDTNTPKIITFWCSFHPYISTGNADRITFLQAKYTQFCNNSRPVCCKWDSMYMEYPLSGSGYCSKILVNVTGIGLDELTETALRQLRNACAEGVPDSLCLQQNCVFTKLFLKTISTKFCSQLDNSRVLGTSAIRTAIKQNQRGDQQKVHVYKDK